MNPVHPPGELPPNLAAKVQRRVLPLLLAGWFVSHLDRFNISFAALQMNEQLALSATTFGLGAGIFFLGYSVFEIPSNLMLVRVGARRWLGRIMISWGIVTMVMAAVRGAVDFVLLRFLLGVTEAGCFPGMALYLSRWLPPRDRTDALAKLGAVTQLSAIVGAPLAAGLLALDGTAGLAGWQWLFLIEGLPAIVLGACLLAWLPERPAAAPWLNDQERQWLGTHAAREGGDGEPTRGAMSAVLRDQRYWVWAAAFFCFSAAGSTLRLWQPLIFRDFVGQGQTSATLLTLVPSIVGMVAIVAAGRHSARADERRWHVVVPMVLAGVGFVLVGLMRGVPGALFAASLATVGVAAQPPLFAMVSSAATGATNAVGIAFVNSVALIGGFIGPYVWGALLDSTGSLVLVTALFGLVMAGGGLSVLSAGDGFGATRDTRLRPAPSA